MTCIDPHKYQQLPDLQLHETLEGLDPTIYVVICGLSCHKDHGSYYADGFGENIIQTGFEVQTIHTLDSAKDDIR